MTTITARLQTARRHYDSLQVHDLAALLDSEPYSAYDHIDAVSTAIRRGMYLDGRQVFAGRMFEGCAQVRLIEQGTRAVWRRGE